MCMCVCVSGGFLWGRALLMLGSVGGWTEKEKSELGVKDGGGYVSAWGRGKLDAVSERLPFDSLTLTYSFCW